MNGFIAKVARLAVSKAAAFGYAVAVGVAGNIAFHYVELPAQPPATVAARPVPEGAAAVPAPPAIPAPAATPATRAVPVVARPEPKRAAPPRPAEPHRAVASAPVLPEPPAMALPPTDALPPPVLRPAALPSEAALRPAAPAARHPAALPADQSAAVTPPPTPAAPAPFALPPLGPAIEVDAPPTPPTADALPLPAPHADTAGLSKRPPPTQPPSTAPRGGLEISDLWHPGRAVRRGLHWAGRQVPVIGDGDGELPPRPAPHHAAVGTPHAAVAAPIPLLPATSESGSPGHGDAGSPPRKPSAPGPGSGGLY